MPAPRFIRWGRHRLFAHTPVENSCRYLGGDDGSAVRENSIRAEAVSCVGRCLRRYTSARVSDARSRANPLENEFS
jgi:hypothetical protein